MLTLRKALFLFRLCLFNSSLISPWRALRMAQSIQVFIVMPSGVVHPVKGGLNL
jgi:hypothetical protein